MTLPEWFGSGGRTLDVFTDDESDGRWQLHRFFQIVSPLEIGESVPITVERAIAGPAGEQIIVGTGTFWGSEQARFGISVRDASAVGGAQHAPTGAWVAKPVRLAGDVIAKLPRLTTDTFWMILSATAMDDPWLPEPGEPPMLPMARHLVGTVEIAGRTVLTRLTLRGETLTAELDFAGELTEIEAAAMGHPTGDLHGDALTFADLAGLFGNEHDAHADLKWLPDVLQKPIRAVATGVGLKDVHFRVDPADDEKLVAVGAVVALGGAAEWRVIPDFDLLKVSDVEVAFDVEHPLDSGARSPRVGISGVIRLGVSDAVAGKEPAEIGIQARWPDLAVTGQLRRGREHSRERDNPTPKEHPIYVKDLLEALHLPSITHGAGPSISNLSFRARPTGKQRSFEIHATVDDALEFPLGGSTILQVRSVEMALALERGENRSLAARIAGELAIARSAKPGPPATTLRLSAETDHGSDGWLLSGWMVGEPITVGDLGAWLSSRFGEQSLPRGAFGDVDAGLSAFSLAFHTASKDTALHIEAGLEMGPATGTLALDVSLSHHGGDHFETHVGGELTVETSTQNHVFELLFAKDTDSSGGAPGATDTTELLIAAYRNPGGTTVGTLLEALGLDLPIPIVLSNALVAHGEERFLCLVDMGMGFDLSHLPFVGKMLPPDQNLSLALRVYGATKDAWGPAEVAALNGELPDGFASVDVPATGATLPTAGLHLALGIADAVVALDLGVGLDQKVTTAGGGTPTPDQIPTAQNAGGDEGVQWVPIQRKLGPVHLRRVGAQYKSATATEVAAIELALDGDLSLGGLTLSLEGLTVTSPLVDPTKEFRPIFGLRGLGLDFRSGSLEIGGALLMIGPDDFAGAAVVRTDKLSLSALGSYKKVGHTTSLFVYAVLDYPLGGPSFFFVTGLAAGFGYNRRLVMPEPGKIAEYPLIVEAVGGASGAEPLSGGSLTAKLATLAEYVPYSPGDMFFAVGVKFTSFKLLDSFALLVVSIGTQLRLDVLGMSTMVAPVPKERDEGPTPLAEIQVALHAEFVPDEGLLGVDARLTPASFVLSKQCHLQGGFAFYSWFSGPHAGDFVVTMGGYHPDFKVPSYYPTVPRLTFVWRVSDEVAIKGDAYYALTGHALMAGGSLNATFDSGSFHAWFRMGVDFLIAWQPYHYDAHAFVSVGAKWHFLEAELGIDVHLWGPEFSGTAEVDLTLTSFTVTFGSGTGPPPPFIGWSAFRAAFLPAEDEICTIVCQTGLVRQLDPPGKDVDPDAPDVEWVVSAHDVVIALASQVPSTAAAVNGVATTAELAWDGTSWQPSLPVGDVGGGPMGIEPSELTSEFAVKVSYEKHSDSAEFRLEPVFKRLPAAVWGAPDPEPRAGGESWVTDAFTGFTLRPKPHTSPHESPPMPKADLGYDDHLIQPSSDTRPMTTMRVDADQTPPQLSTEAAEAAATDVARNGSALLAGLGIDPGTMRPRPGLDDAYLFAPRRGRSAMPVSTA